jgi:hypothetical protein
MTFHPTQLRRRWPHFEPTNVLDYGSGIASTAWYLHIKICVLLQLLTCVFRAIGDLWPDVNFNYTGIELSQDMINLSLDLLESWWASSIFKPSTRSFFQ